MSISFISLIAERKMKCTVKIGEAIGGLLFFL